MQVPAPAMMLLKIVFCIVYTPFIKGDAKYAELITSLIEKPEEPSVAVIVHILSAWDIVLRSKMIVRYSLRYPFQNILKKIK